MPRKAPTKLAFTVARLQDLVAPAKGRAYVYDTKSGGLCLCVTSAGTMTFYWYGKVDGRPERIRLGKFPGLSIGDAREAAARHTARIAQGRNPVTERKARREGPTLGDLFDHWMVTHANVHKKPKSASEDARQYGQYLEPWANRRLVAIKKTAVASLHAKIGRENGHYAANRVLNLLSSMFNKGGDLGYEGANPCRGVVRFKEQPRDRFLLAGELRAFFDSLNEEGDSFRTFFMLCLLTGARRSNVQAMRWDEIDFPSAVWRIPDTKAGTPQRVPLVEPAARLLQTRLDAAGDSPWVFPTKSKTGHLTEPKGAWKRIVKRAGLHDVRLHDLRRSLGSWMAGAGVGLPLIGKTLGHKQQATTAIYARLDLEPVRDAMGSAVAAMLTAGGVLDVQSRGVENGEE